jgi:hypothetical protein
MTADFEEKTMQAVTIRVWRVVWVAALALVLLSGCRRAGPALGRALAEGEKAGARSAGRAAVKAEQAVGRVAVKAEQAAAHERPSAWKKVGEGLRDKAIDVAVDQGTDWAMKQARSDEPTPERFPNPAAVVPLANTRAVFDERTGLYGQPNNYGGRSFYYPDGKPAGFSAVHAPSGQVHFFDPFGNRLR